MNARRFDELMTGLGRTPTRRNTNHVYEIDTNGHGRPLSLHFTDPVTRDNSLNVAVEVACLGKAAWSARQRPSSGSVPAPSAGSANMAPAAGRRS